MSSTPPSGLLPTLLGRWKNIPRIVRAFWLVCAISLPVWAHFDNTAWDFNVYAHALDSLQNGHDPYVDATDIQKQHHQQRSAADKLTNEQAPPYSYVYAPMTLPLLRALGHLPGKLLVPLYVLVYLIGALAAVAVCASLAEGSEYPGILYLAAVAVFFPGLLANGVILSGNVAYILYGAILAGAYLGWHRNRWMMFYTAVLLAACVKAPLLSLVLIAPLSARKQWLPTAGVIATFLAVYALQPVAAPVLFHHYLEAVELQFSFNQDFGCGPAGLYSNYLVQHGRSYAPSCYVAYLAYVVPVFAGLLYGARQFHRGKLTLQQWAPVLLVGVILINPRIMEYDAAPITLPMALILWRVAQAMRSRNTMYSLYAVAFFILNALSVYSWLIRKAIDGPLILLTCVAGFWLLHRHSSIPQRAVQSQPDQLVTA